MSKSLRIFVGGLKVSTTQEELQKYFSGFGELTDAVIIMERNKRKNSITKNRVVQRLWFPDL